MGWHICGVSIDKLSKPVCVCMIYLRVDPLACRPGFLVVGLKRNCVSFFLFGGIVVLFENGVVVVVDVVDFSLMSMLSN